MIDPTGPNSNPTDFYTRNKGKKLPAVVEAVLSGSMLRVLLVPSFREVVVRVAGAQAPATRRGQKEEPRCHESHAGFTGDARKSIPRASHRVNMW